MKQGWTYKKLKEVGRTQTGTTPSKSVKSFYEGEIPFIRPAELDIDGNGSIEYNSELKLTPEGALKSRKISANSILMCCIGSVGKTGYAIKDVTCNQQINTITPYMGYNGRFVYYALMAPSFQNEVKKIANSAKATLAIISKGKWEELSIPVPPLSEQQSIVDYLDSVFAQIDELKSNAEKQLAEARTLFQSALTQAMQPKPGWQEKKFIDVFDDITDFVAAGSFADLRKNVVYNSEIDYAQLIRTTDLKNRFNNKSFVYVNEHAFKYLWRVNLNEECIILPNVGVNCGEVYYLHPSMLKHTNNVLGPNAILVRSRKVNNRFLAYYLQGIDFQKEIKHITSSMAQPKYNKTNLKTRIVHYPSANEQKALVAYLDSLSARVNDMQEISRKTAAECDAMKQALLRQIFE